jgi:hypothetical protein
LLKVIDSNYLQDPGLETYLASSRSNRAVITELIAIEMNKKAAVQSAPDYLRILCRFSNQVLILRDSYEWHNRRIRTTAQARSIICKEQTEYFSEFCVSVYEQPQDPRFVDHLEQEEKKARWHIDELTKQSEHQEKVFAAIAERFSTRERGELIARVPFSQSTVTKLLDLVNFVTIQLLDDAEVPEKERPRNMVEALDTYLFRYALCMILLYTRWMTGGGKPTGKRKDRLTNDVVDMQIVATSTFYGGLLSHDRKPVDVSREARRILRGMRAFVG